MRGLAHFFIAPCVAAFGLLLLAETVNGGAWPYLPYPYGPVVALNPFDPGDEPDLLVEAVAPVFQERTGQALVARSMPGRAGATAWGWLAEQQGDGYTVAVTLLPNYLLRAQEKYPVYALNDMRTVCLFAEMPLALWVPEKSPYRTLQDVIKAARVKPGSVVLSGAGSNSIAHMASLMFNRQNGVRTQFLPYTGNLTAMQAAQGDTVQAVWAFASPGFAERMEARALAVAAPDRVAGLPDVPTFRELKNDLVLSGIFGFAAPADTPPKTLQDMNSLFYSLATDPKVHGRLMLYGFTPKPMNSVPAWEMMQNMSQSLQEFRLDYPMD